MELILHLCLLFVPVILPNAVASSHDNHGGRHGRRYDAYNYDMTTPQFTPDGRLLQVEYATNACIRDDSNPIVSVGISVPGDTVLIMATISSPPTSPSSQMNLSQKGQGSDEQLEQIDEKDITSHTKENNQRTQFRIIEVPLSASYRHSSRQHTSTSTILVGLSGLLSDATSLLQIAYSHLEEEQSMFGWHRLGLSPVGISTVDDSISDSASRSLEPSLSKQSQSIVAQPSETVLRISRAIADKCQTHAFGGGLRPIGASLLLAGLDDIMEKGDNSCQKHGARIAMSETHPNGSWRSLVSTAKSDWFSHNESNDINTPKDEENTETSIDILPVMVSGGPAQSQHMLKSLMESRLRELYQRPFGVENPARKNTLIDSKLDHVEGKDKDKEFLRQVLQTVMSSLVEEWKNRGDPRSSSSAASSVTARPGEVKCEANHEELQQPALPQMEVVIASSKQGTFRLHESDIARMMRPIVLNR
ncbi:hypothetical protein ACHAXR_012446 [Thalassiosira sp. AJA248-18]